jgi:hypothetical protein
LGRDHKDIKRKDGNPGEREEDRESRRGMEVEGGERGQKLEPYPVPPPAQLL